MGETCSRERRPSTDTAGCGIENIRRSQSVSTVRSANDENAAIVQNRHRVPGARRRERSRKTEVARRGIVYFNCAAWGAGVVAACNNDTAVLQERGSWIRSRLHHWIGRRPAVFRWVV